MIKTPKLVGALLYFEVYSILSKSGPKFNTFVSSFQSTRLTLGASFTMHSLDVSAASLIQEQDKLS